MGNVVKLEERMTNLGRYVRVHIHVLYIYIHYFHFVATCIYMRKKQGKDIHQSSQ